MSNIDLEPKYKEKLDIQFLFNKQIDRCLFHSGTELFDYHVQTLQRLLPQTSFNQLEALADQYTEEVPILEFEAPGGEPLGTKTNPLLLDERKPVKRHPGEVDWTDPNIAGSINTSEDPDYVIEEYILFDRSKPVLRLQGEVDWSDPNIWSPKKVDDDIRVDYSKLFKMILTEAENIGILWDLLKETMVIKIKTSKPQKNPTPNPNIEPKDMGTIEL